MKKILYIEDHEDTAEAVKKILNQAGFSVDLAKTGVQGIKKAETAFDGILLDIMLPDMSGWDVFKKLKKSKEKTKYLLLSALPISSERMTELKRRGIADYITKPFKREDLVKRIKKALQ